MLIPGICKNDSKVSPSNENENVAKPYFNVELIRILYVY